MSKVWKWVLGILIVVLVVGALVAIPFVMRNYMAAYNPQATLPQNGVPFGGPMMRGFNWYGHPMMRGGYGDFDDRRMPMFGGGFGFRRDFGFGFLFLGWFFRLIPLALLVLVIFGVYQLGKRSGMRSNQFSSPAAPPPAAPVEPEQNNPGLPAA